MAKSDQSGNMAADRIQRCSQGLHVGGVESAFFGSAGDVYHPREMACRAFEKGEEELGDAQACIEA